MKRKHWIYLILTASLCSCYNRKDINDYSGNVVVKRHQGFDGLEDSYYVLKNIQTGKVIHISVEPSMADIYQVNDTIK